ncbi:MAG: DUF305 domain-containing protein [Nocardioides sp.]|nr:DUF305 domain-containing protein [Nocardioides sp.]
MEISMRKTLAAIALLATVGLALTACGEDTDSDATATENASAVNDVDVAFAQQMIPHHEQAVEMAQMAQGRASSEEVLTLAEGIEAAQGPEIETLQGWLEAWGEDVPASGLEHGDMGHDSDDPMSGMMDEAQMSDLMAASGVDWDRMFLEMMIEHHEGAVEMAEVEVDQGENPDAVALAGKIISDQQAEITQMQQLLQS